MNSTYTLSHISIKTIYSNHIFLEYNKKSGIFTTKQIADDTFQLLAIFYSVIFHPGLFWDTDVILVFLSARVKLDAEHQYVLLGHLLQMKQRCLNVLYVRF